MPVANPYTSQLAEFTGGISNARRGLKDLYKLRTRAVDTHVGEVKNLYQAAGAKTGEQYASSTKALGGFEGQGLDYTRASGYQVDDTEVAKAVRGIIGEATNPYKAFLGAEGKAQAKLYRGLRSAEIYEDKTLKTGLRREQPAALSELEQGIVDTQTNLQQQGAAFAQQQAYNASMTSFQNQMLGYQRQIAQGQGGPTGGGGTGKETPNTSQWQSYAAQRWGVTVGGWRAHGSVPGSDHPKGRAIDIMSSGSLLQSIANDFVSQAGSRGVSYVIANGQIWTPGRGWHRYTGPNPHTDHVHVSFAY